MLKGIILTVDLILIVIADTMELVQGMIMTMITIAMTVIVTTIMIAMTVIVMTVIVTMIEIEATGDQGTITEFDQLRRRRHHRLQNRKTLFVQVVPRERNTPDEHVRLSIKSCVVPVGMEILIPVQVECGFRAINV